MTGGGHDVIHDMLMLGTGHEGEEGAIDHALLLLAPLMRDTNVAWMFAQPARLTALTALLLPSAARQDAAKAVLIVLREQCDSVAAAVPPSSAEALATYPLEAISSSVIAAAAPPSLLFLSSARVLLS